MRSRTVVGSSMRPNESHDPLRSVVVIGRVSAAQMPALSRPNLGLQAPRLGPSKTFKSTVRQSGGRSPTQPSETAARRPNEGRPSAAKTQQLGWVHKPMPRIMPC